MINAKAELNSLLNSGTLESKIAAARAAAGVAPVRAAPAALNTLAADAVAAGKKAQAEVRAAIADAAQSRAEKVATVLKIADIVAKLG